MTGSRSDKILTKNIFKNSCWRPFWMWCDNGEGHLFFYWVLISLWRRYLCVESSHTKKSFRELPVATTQIARFMGPTWGPSGSCRHQMGSMLAPWTLLSGETRSNSGKLTTCFRRFVVTLADQFVIIHQVELVPSVQLDAAHDAGEALQVIDVILRATNYLSRRNAFIAPGTLRTKPSVTKQIFFYHLPGNTVNDISNLKLKKNFVTHNCTTNI